ncbi:MAG: hypothetical protein KUG64_11095 [Cycloclasticus sp.]|nr:hypothetical protein [Cycloclasticus sp.]
MIFVNAQIQAIMGGQAIGGFNPAPLPFHMEGKWRSVAYMDIGVYDDSGSRITLSQTSDDDGTTFSVTNTQENFDSSAVTKLLYKPIPTFSGNGIIGRKQGIDVWIKRGDSDWEKISMSSIGGSFSGGTLASVTFDPTNNEFIIVKTGTGVDLITTTDFITFVNPVITDPIEGNPISDELTVQTVQYISGGYKAYGKQLDDSAIQRVATSTDLKTWTLSGTTQPSSATVQLSYDTVIAFFNSRYFVHFFSGATPAVEIWSSTDGTTWTQATLTGVTGGGEKGLYWQITSAAIELHTTSQVLRSTNGTTWTEELIENNILQSPDGFSVDGANGIGVYAHAKGYITSTETAPGHISLSTGSSLQLNGKVVELTGLNATPTLGYPSSAAEGATLGWLQRNFALNQVTGDGFTLVGDTGTLRNTRSFYARNTATTRYFEVEILSSTGTANKIGARVMDDSLITDVSVITTDIAYFLLEEDLISTPNGNDIVVTYSATTGQIIGFLFDWTAQTCVIAVDGVTLGTVTSLNNIRSWTVDADVSNGQYKLNVGQEAFSHNGTGATAWQTA